MQGDVLVRSTEMKQAYIEVYKTAIAAGYDVRSALDAVKAIMALMSGGE